MDGVDPNEWKSLLGRANAGELYLDPEVGRGLDKVCDDHIDRLQDALVTGREVTHVTGFGDFNSSHILEEKFSALATGHDQAVDTILKQHIDSANTAKQVVAKAIANYEALDDDHRRQIEKLAPQ
jgi:uncharacterized protein with ATP-grasp and redox domains